MRNETRSAGPRQPDEDVFGMAADWHTRREDDDLTVAERAQFDAWFGASAKHRDAYHAMERMWSRMDGMRADPRILHMRRDALAGCADADASRAAPRTTAFARRRPWALAASILAGCAALLLCLRYFPAGGPAISAEPAASEGGVFRTAIGGLSTITLSDGSSVVLNTDSEVDVRFTSTERRVRLLKGQAWFDVAKSPSRPFTVDAGGERVRALGTIFDVQVGAHGETIQVALAEGRVRVEPIRSGFSALLAPHSQPTDLLPGEAVTITGDHPVREHVDLAKVGSWRTGKLVFDNDTLATAIAQLNRYTHAQIALSGSALAGLRVSGVFKAGQNKSFLEALTGHYPIRIAEQGPDRIVLAPASP